MALPSKRPHRNSDPNATAQAPAAAPPAATTAADDDSRPLRGDLGARTFGHWRPGPASAWRPLAERSAEGDERHDR
jgi:hypothetical protein